ncbi:MAG: hypothetical protein KTR28_06305 [Micavibrio sp.]|nr:hypothetical protein [Micavibrio sp.]
MFDRINTLLPTSSPRITEESNPYAPEQHDQKGRNKRQNHGRSRMLTDSEEDDYRTISINAVNVYLEKLIKSKRELGKKFDETQAEHSQKDRPAPSPKAYYATSLYNTTSKMADISDEHIYKARDTDNDGMQFSEETIPLTALKTLRKDALLLQGAGYTHIEIPLNGNFIENIDHAIKRARLNL